MRFLKSMNVIAPLISFLFQTHTKLRRLEGRDGPPGRPVGWEQAAHNVDGQPGGSSLPLPLLAGLSEQWDQPSKPFWSVCDL